MGDKGHEHCADRQAGMQVCVDQAGEGGRRPTQAVWQAVTYLNHRKGKDLNLTTDTCGRYVCEMHHSHSGMQSSAAAIKHDCWMLTVCMLFLLNSMVVSCPFPFQPRCGSPLLGPTHRPSRAQGRHSARHQHDFIVDDGHNHLLASDSV
jgi:hypothetical protein